jgi:hypothetical protein
MTNVQSAPPRPAGKLRPAVALGAVALALVLVPAPLLPPSSLVAALQAAMGCGRSMAYLVAAIGLHMLLYGALGATAAFAVDPGQTSRQRWLRFVLVPVVVVILALAVRSLKLGHVPMLTNAIVPMVACGFGAAVAVAFRQHGLRPTLFVTSLLLATVGVLHWPGASAVERRSIEAQLQRFVAAGPTLPSGDQRFGRLLQLAFSPDAANVGARSAVEQNAAAILALGIVVGHERLSRFAGMDRNDDLVRAAAQLRRGTTLREREDWARHFCLSAALAVVESGFVSDLGGLLKEEVDSLAKGSGFSFGDLAADRAGVRFAAAATASQAAALAVQARLQAGFAIDDVFPPVADLAENLTVEQFRANFGGVGAPKYRAVVAEIEARLDRCAGLQAR